MCVIAIYRMKREKEANLRDMAKENPDGTGVVYYAKDVPHYKKGLEIKEVLELNKTLEFPYAFHFRITTVGHNKMLTHPYEVTPKSELKMEGSADSLLMHNGHWGGWDEALWTHSINNGVDIPNGDWSDSRAMAFLGGTIGTNMLKMLTGQKIALFQKGKKITVLGHGWENDKEFLYSNKHWEKKQWTRNSYQGCVYRNGAWYEAGELTQQDKDELKKIEDEEKNATENQQSWLGLKEEVKKLT